MGGNCIEYSRIPFTTRYQNTCSISFLRLSVSLSVIYQHHLNLDKPTVRAIFALTEIHKHTL